MILRKTLSIMLVLGLIIGGLPIFFSQNAEAAAVVVVERDDSAFDIMASRGYLYVDVSRFEDEGGEPIPGYTMLVEWDYCYMELNPLAGFLQTKRVHKTATLISDEKGEASYVFDLPNGCWTENAWLRGAAQGWQSPPDFFLGQMASRSLHLDLYTQPSGATGYAIARADTLGLIQDWYELVPYEISTSYAKPVLVYGSKAYAGSAKLIVSALPTIYSAGTTAAEPSHQMLSSASATFGTVVDYKRTANSWFCSFYSTGMASITGRFTPENVRSSFGDQAVLGGSEIVQGGLKVTSQSSASPNVWTISNADIYGPRIDLKFAGTSGQSNLRYQIYVNGALVYPEQGGWQSGGAREFSVNLPFSLDGLLGNAKMDLSIRAYSTTSVGSTTCLDMQMVVPQKAEFVLSDLTEDVTSTALSLITSTTVTADLSGHWGEWQISGMSSTLTDEDLVPVNACITRIYPMVISNPRFDKTPIAGGGNGLKFDAYNLKSEAANETVYLSLIADDNTTVWATTVGQQSYPAWVNESQFTTVHLTDISFPAEPRKEYNLRITSGGAITEIPVVFYPAELDPEEIYDQKEELDEIRDSFATANAAALKAYYDWAVEMELLNVEMASQIENYSKIFESFEALDELEAAKDASLRAAEMITALKEICKGDPAGTNIGELEALGIGIWNSYLAALLHREAAVGYEAGDTAFANSTASDAWYIDLNGKRIYVGWNDKGGEYNDPSSLAMWIGLAVALIAGGLVFLVSWTRIPKLMPKGGSKTMRQIKAVAPLLIAIVAAVVVALVGFFVTAEIVVGIEAALADLGSLFG
jgi:hypothetical protein